MSCIQACRRGRRSTLLRVFSSAICPSRESARVFKSLSLASFTWYQAGIVAPDLLGLAVYTSSGPDFALEPIGCIGRLVGRSRILICPATRLASSWQLPLPTLDRQEYHARVESLVRFHKPANVSHKAQWQVASYSRRYDESVNAIAYRSPINGLIGHVARYRKFCRIHDQTVERVVCVMMKTSHLDNGGRHPEKADSECLERSALKGGTT
jgi:hypothetical protein